MNRRINRALSIVVLNLLYVGICFGQQKPTAPNPAFNQFLKREFRLTENQVLPYRILYPENYDKKNKYPLVLFLHGSGGRAKDNEKHLKIGAKLFLEETTRKNFPAIVIFPQCPEESNWGSFTADRSVRPIKAEFNYENNPTWPLVAANELVMKLLKEESVDKSRVYISGLSMGGIGTFESVYRYPQLYAAALPICGGGDVDKYDERIAKTSFWIFHGSADSTVSVNLSRSMKTKLETLKANVKYSEYAGVDHNSWDNAFAEPTFFNWMFLQNRK
jgi:predicted peptidase